MLLAVQTVTFVLGLLPVLGPSLPESPTKLLVVLGVTTLKSLLIREFLETGFVFAYMMFIWLGALLADIILQFLYNSGIVTCVASFSFSRGSRTGSSESGVGRIAPIMGSSKMRDTLIIEHTPSANTGLRFSHLDDHFPF